MFGASPSASPRAAELARSHASEPRRGSHGATPTILLNVGGTHFEVARSTLTGKPGMLQTLVDRWDPGTEALFIDRDPTLFPGILAWLRDGPKMALPEPKLRSALQREANFFGLAGLEDHLGSVLSREMLRTIVTIDAGVFGCTQTSGDAAAGPAKCKCGWRDMFLTHAQAQDIPRQFLVSQLPPLRRVSTFEWTLDPSDKDSVTSLAHSIDERLQQLPSLKVKEERVHNQVWRVPTPTELIQALEEYLTSFDINDIEVERCLPWSVLGRPACECSLDYPGECEGGLDCEHGHFERAVRVTLQRKAKIQRIY